MFLSARKLVIILIAINVLTATNVWSKESIKFTNIVDLTHILSSKFPIVPVPGLTFPFEQKPIASLAKNRVFAEEWHMIAHNGTHMDAPIHYIEGGRSMEAYDVRELIVPAVVIDIRKKAENNPDTQLTVDDIQNWEKQYGQISKGVAVFMYSGWDEKAINDPKKFVGLDSKGETHFPTLSVDAVNFLLTERGIIGVGVDTLSFDQVENTQKASAHKALFQADRWGVECVNNLGKIPPKGATIFVGALKVEGASASPIRLIAVW
jgi:kynurenine formamidase